MNVDDTITQFCICDEEMCWCTKTKDLEVEAVMRGEVFVCDECRSGEHVLERPLDV